MVYKQLMIAAQVDRIQDNNYAILMPWQAFMNILLSIVENGE